MESQDNSQRIYKGMVQDTSPVDQPKDTYRFALNGLVETFEGDSRFLSTENSTDVIEQLTVTDFQNATYECRVIGSIKLQDDNIVLFLLGTEEDVCSIAILDKAGYLVHHVTSYTNVLSFSKEKRIYGEFRLRRNNERVIYFVDGLNKPRYYNFERPYDFYSSAYQQSIDDGTTYEGEFWDPDKFNLIRQYNIIPEFISCEVVEGGNIPSGSYSAAIQLVDDNLNPTEWITVSNPVNIYEDSSGNEFPKIRGSMNNTEGVFAFNNASKSIKWTIANIDPSFTYYRIAILQANKGDGNINKAIVSPLIQAGNNTFSYSGNDSDYTETPISDIQAGRIDIETASHIVQLENRLILGGIKGTQIDFCGFQAYASRITSQIRVFSVEAENAEAIGNPKNPIRSVTGYMPGEVYSFGIVYIFNDGTESPVFHIPGRRAARGDTPEEIALDEAALLASTGMEYYGCTESKYLPVHTCMQNEYWGEDHWDDDLVDTPIRHHKFPQTVELISETSTPIQTGVEVEAKCKITYSASQFVSGEQYWCNIRYKINGVSRIYAIKLTGAYWIGNAPVLEIGLGTFPEGTMVSDLWLEWIEGGSYIRPVDYTTITVVDSTDYFVPVYTTKTTYTVNTYGIRFGEIVKPHPDVVAYKIVRNERTDDDKLIADNVIIGPMLNTPIPDGEDVIDNEYHSFGLLSPNVSTINDVDEEKYNLSQRAVWVFSPEHQFLNKRVTFDSIYIRGCYIPNDRYLHAYSDLSNPCDDCDGVPLQNKKHCLYGLYIDDVRPGTTFNSAYEKGEDPDGFSLQVQFRSTNFDYSNVIPEGVELPDPDHIHYISAAGSKRATNNQYLYNASGDNKIMILEYDDVEGSPVLDPSAIFDEELNIEDGKRLLYASLVKNNEEAYSNFINRPYIKQHENPIYMDSDVNVSTDIYAGDVYTTPATICSSTYWDTHFADRNKKKRVWKIVVGALLVVAGVIVSFASFGGATPLGIAIAAYGISMAISGIEFETMKDMFDLHYEAGLKNTLTDDDNQDYYYNDMRGTCCVEDDDAIQWFTDRIDNIWIQSSVNMGLRNGTTIPCSDFINSPSVKLELPTDACSTATLTTEQMESYLTDKFTIIDRDNNSGRLYAGYPFAEIYSINKDYLRLNNEKLHYYLPIEYECCSDIIESFPNRVMYSEQSYQEEKIDNFRKFLPNNYRDIEGEHGIITNMFRVQENLFIHTEEGLFMLPQNLQERVNQELVSFIGTGEFFAIPPRKTFFPGSRHKDATINTPFGIAYVSEHDRKVVLYDNQATVISNAGMSKWFQNNLELQFPKYMKYTFGIDYPMSANTSFIQGVGIHSGYDSRFKRLLVTKIDFLPLETPADYDAFIEQGAQGPVEFFAYSINENKFYWVEVIEDEGELVIYPYEKDLGDPEYFRNLSWTISYSMETNSWVSFHSYLPSYYINADNYFYSVPRDINSIYIHNIKGNYLQFYTDTYPFIIDYVSLSNPLMERIWNNISLHVSAEKYDDSTDSFIHNNTLFFKWLIAYNNRQSTGLQEIITTDMYDAEQLMIATIQDDNERVTAKNTEGTWSISDLRDFVDDYTVPLFTTDWAAIKDDYFIDKLVNSAAINIAKDWTELESLRGKYLQIRLIYTNFVEEGDDQSVKLIVNYTFENEQPSLR